MKWNIEFYENNSRVPVLDFILTLPAKMQSKIYRKINLLEEFGINRIYPYTNKIEGTKYKGLWELRIKLGSNNTRIFYFLFKTNTFVLLNGFHKKTAKTPSKHLKLAKQYMNDYIERK